MSPLRRRMIEDMQIRNLAAEHATCVCRAGFPLRLSFS